MKLDCKKNYIIQLIKKISIDHTIHILTHKQIRPITDKNSIFFTKIYMQRACKKHEEESRARRAKL